MKNIDIIKMIFQRYTSFSWYYTFTFKLIIHSIFLLLESISHNLKSFFPHFIDSLFLFFILDLFFLNLFYFLT